MRARFLEAASALTRRAEQLEDRVLRTTMEKNSLQAQLQLKTEAEIRAATLADDLRALVGHYRLLTQNVLVHGAFNDGGGNTTTANLLFTSATGGLHGQQHSQQQKSRFAGAARMVPGGSFKRTHLLQRQNTNVPPSFFGVHYVGAVASAKHSSGLGGGKYQQQQGATGVDDQDDESADHVAGAAAMDQQQYQQHQPAHQFQAMFLVDVGGKKATRDIVMENAALRERLMATEWRNDKFLKDAIMSAFVEEYYGSHDAGASGITSGAAVASAAGAK
jgi:hypothetical protein